jgi:hypothetical protein
MQHDQVKTAVNRIRHAQVPVKQGFSRLRHDHAIDGINGAARGRPGFPEVIERPKHCGFRKQGPMRDKGSQILHSGHGRAGRF